jgi:hypothetical protein
MLAPATGGGSLILLGAGVGVSIGDATIDKPAELKEAQSAQKAAQQRAASAAKKGYELQAGDYAKQTAFEMKLNAAESQFQSLVDVIMNRQATPPNIMNLPAAENPSPIAKINQAIDDLLKGKW